jgi:YHS domain-containing protein
MKTPQLLVALSLLIALSGCTTLKVPTFADDEGAIRGYDPVAYHLEGMPVKGDPRYFFAYRESTWHFSSEDNRDEFRRDPDRYAPQYGGFCAYAMSKGFVVSTDPDAWTIVDGKLYLNYSLGVRKTWLKDVPGYVDKADDKWKEKLSQPDFN